jgi:phosphoserine phosphatase
VVQGPSLTENQAKEIGPAEQISAGAWRIRNAKTIDVAWCEERHVDYAFVPEGRHFSDLKLLAMDMDSTLITMETIDELGDLVGKKAEIAAITARAMRGEIDYPESLRQRVSLLKGLDEKGLLKVYEERLKLSPGADALLAACKRHGVKTLLVSGGFTFFVERLKTRLGIDYAISNTLEITAGRLTGQVIGDIVDAEAKARKFREVATNKAQTVAIGDGANDLKMMAEAGLSVAFHAKPVVRAQASCALTWSGLDGVLNLFE